MVTNKLALDSLKGTTPESVRKYDESNTRYDYDSGEPVLDSDKFILLVISFAATTDLCNELVQAESHHH